MTRWLQTQRANLLGLAMQRVLAIPRTIFFEFDTRAVVLFVFLSRIVAPLTLGTFECHDQAIFFLCHYSITFVMTPAPTVRPPSRIAKCEPFSNATGVINLTFIETLSPGITISTPCGNCTSPVTSNVRT